MARGLQMRAVPRDPDGGGRSSACEGGRLGGRVCGVGSGRALNGLGGVLRVCGKGGRGSRPRAG